MIDETTTLDLQAMRLAAQQRQWTSVQDIFKRLISELDPLVALQIPAEQVQAFLPVFESYYPEATWVRELALTVVAYASAPRELPVHVLNQFPSPGCGNFLMSVFELAWSVEPDYTVFERFSHITNATANAILAQLQHLYFDYRPDSFAALHDPEAAADVRSQVQYNFWMDAQVAARDTELWLHVVDAVEARLKER